MTDNQVPPSSVGRRNFIVRAIIGIQATVAATLAFILGSTTLSPSFTRRESTWLKAAALDSLPENQPVPVTLRIMRQDGYSQVVDRTVVFLVRTGEHDVRALHS